MARHRIGEKGVLSWPLPTTCCNYIVPKGEQIKILGRASKQKGKPRIVLIETQGTLHKVKMSKIWFEGEQISRA